MEETGTNREEGVGYKGCLRGDTVGSEYNLDGDHTLLGIKAVFDVKLEIKTGRVIYREKEDVGMVKFVGPKFVGE